MADKPVQDIQGSPSICKKVSEKRDEKVAQQLTENPLWPESVNKLGDIPPAWMLALYNKHTKKAKIPSNVMILLCKKSGTQMKAVNCYLCGPFFLGGWRGRREDGGDDRHRRSTTAAIADGRRRSTIDDDDDDRRRSARTAIDDDRRKAGGWVEDG